MTGGSWGEKRGGGGKINRERWKRKEEGQTAWRVTSEKDRNALNQKAQALVRRVDELGREQVNNPRDCRGKPLKGEVERERKSVKSGKGKMGEGVGRTIARGLLGRR